MTESGALVQGALTGPTGRLVVDRRELLLDALRRHGVTNPRIFGSVARGEDRPGSDLDLLVDFPRGTGLLAIARIQEELEDILGVDVDLIPDAGLKSSVRDRVLPDLLAL